jgi:deazaflavin-dependent oxidoreductase (nitroreductase family)
MSDWNAGIIEEFRKTGGTVPRFGRGLVLLHHIGAKSGVERVTPVAAFPDGDGWVVVASKAGAPENPAWYHNLLAHPDIDIEVPGSDAPVPVTVSVIGADEYDEQWTAVITAAPGFADYKRTAVGRTIPLLRLTKR